MPEPKLNSLTQLMSRTGLADLGAEARRLEALREAVRGLLPADLAPWCLGAEIPKQGTLLVYMASSAAATAVRYRQQVLLEAASRALQQPFSRLETHVMPDPPLPPSPRPTPRTLSEAVRRLLQQTADSVSDPSLARALLRLAQRRGRSSG